MLGGRVIVSMVRAHIIVKGLVQGVYYRVTTKQKADSLDLSGWVKNLPDGDVEVVVEGNKEKIEQLIDWCWQGPPGAKVDGVEVKWSPCQNEYQGFNIVF